MKVLVFDTETTGMVRFQLPPDHAEQPDLIQLGALLVDSGDWSVHARVSTLVTLRAGAQIEPAAHEAHGISEEDCARWGIAPVVACSLFNQFCMQADLIVAHNLSFDESVMKTALFRIGNKPNRIDGRRTLCTKEATTEVLKLPGKYGSYKWPTLAEAYRHYTGNEIEGAHDALVDTEACLAVFRGLVQTGEVDLLQGA